MSMGDFQQEYTKSFQRLLLANLVKDEALLLAAAAVELTDFEIVPCQVVLEATRDFYAKTKTLPDFDALVHQVRKVCANELGDYKTYIKPEEGPALAELLEWIKLTEPMTPGYFIEELPAFVKGVRAAKILDDSRNDAITGVAADGVISKLKVLESEVEASFKSKETIFITAAEDAGLLSLDDWVPPISTGIPELDNLLTGGVNRKEVCLISAPSGVGKTNLLIHLPVAAAYARLHSLFFSLELPGAKVRGRAISMISGIDAKNLKIPVETWDEKDQALVYMAQYRNEVTKRIAFIDSSEMKPTLDDIERKIIEWKARCAEKGVSDDEAAVVCIDWIDYIQLSFGGKQLDDWERYVLVAQELGFLARRNNVVIWIANQTTRAAEGKTILRMGDTARGYHLNDAMDLSIGANTAEEYRVTEENSGAGQGGRRGMNLSVAKNRNGDLGLVKAFRAPSLRMFSSEAAYAAYLTRIRSVNLTLATCGEKEIAEGLVLAQSEGLFG